MTIQQPIVYNGVVVIFHSIFFFQEVDLASDKRKQFRDQKLTTFAEFLRIAKHAGKSVLFDLWQPPPTHPHFSSYINVTLDAIISSGINQSKVGHKCLLS